MFLNYSSLRNGAKAVVNLATSQYHTAASDIDYTAFLA